MSLSFIDFIRLSFIYHFQVLVQRSEFAVIITSIDTYLSLVLDHDLCTTSTQSEWLTRFTVRGSAYGMFCVVKETHSKLGTCIYPAHSAE